MKTNTVFFDTSALLKRYLNERGSDKAISLFKESNVITVSPITHIECVSAFKRLLHTQEIDSETFYKLCDDVNADFSSYVIIEFNDQLKLKALDVLEKYPLKALDTIQLASLLHSRTEVDAFAVCDQQLKKYALKEGFQIIDLLL